MKRPIIHSEFRSVIQRDTVGHDIYKIRVQRLCCDGRPWLSRSTKNKPYVATLWSHKPTNGYRNTTKTFTEYTDVGYAVILLWMRCPFMWADLDHHLVGLQRRCPLW